MYIHSKMGPQMSYDKSKMHQNVNAPSDHPFVIAVQILHIAPRGASVSQG